MKNYDYENNSDDVPYLQMDLDIRDVHQIYKSLNFHHEEGEFMDIDEKNRVEACKDFFCRMILEYKYQIEE